MKNKFGLLHVIIMVYLFAAFSWWAILLSKKNDESYFLKQELLKYGYYESEQQFTNNYEKQKLMIFGEGLVFGLSIIIGLILIQRAFKSELMINKRLNDFLLSVTHELKTPIASLKLANQTLRKRQLDENTTNELLDTCIDETLRLESQVNNILTAAQIEQSYKFNFELMALDELIMKSTRRFSTIFPYSNIETKLIPVNVKADQEALTKAIDNVINNAIKYSPPGAPIQVALVKEASNAIISIKDMGLGISDLEKTKILDKFYRVGNEETRSSKGTGLGLWLTKKILDAHKGKIKISDNTPTGTIFNISIPYTL